MWRVALLWKDGPGDRGAAVQVFCMNLFAEMKFGAGETEKGCGQD